MNHIHTGAKTIEYIGNSVKSRVTRLSHPAMVVNINESVSLVVDEVKFS